MPNSSAEPTPGEPARGLCAAHALRAAIPCVAAVLLAAASGCAPKISFLGETPCKEWTVLVMPLSDYEGEHLAVDYTFYGRTGTQGSGPLIARELRKALAQQEGFRLTPSEAIAAYMREESFTLDDTSRRLPDGRICRMARDLSADMIVRGEVYLFRSSWILFVPRNKINFELRGLDPRTNEVMWRTRIKKRAWYKTTTTLTRRCAKKLATALAEHYTPVQ